MATTLTDVVLRTLQADDHVVSITEGNHRIVITVSVPSTPELCDAIDEAMPLMPPKSEA